MRLGILILTFFCRFKKELVTNLIQHSILDLRNGAMIISISRYTSFQRLLLLKLIMWSYRSLLKKRKKNVELMMH